MKTLSSRYLRRSRRLNLGSGSVYIPNFLNIDANILRKPDIWLDIRNGIPLPTASIESIYCSQFLEHFYPNELYYILRECYRVLQNTGGIRIIVPNLKNAIFAYTNGKKEFFLEDSNYWRNRNTIGGRFSNFMFCDGQHRQAFDYDHIHEILTEVGFQKIIEQAPRKSIIYTKKFLKMYEIKDDLSLRRFLYAEAFKRK